MTDNQHYAHMWLKRMWDLDDEIKQYVDNAESMLGAKIPAYDSEKIPGGADPNPTESKNIEYTVLMGEIDKKLSTLQFENLRTYQIIQLVDDPKLRGMLYARYVNRKSWKVIGQEFHYEKSQTFEYRKKMLDAVYPYIPKGEVTEDE